VETALGPYDGGLNPMSLTPQLGLPGLNTISQVGSNPSYGSGMTSSHELTTIADELNEAQALCEAIRSSRTDMTSAVPAQRYCEDTRNSRWTVTNTNNGLSTSGDSTAYLSSPNCVDLPTTRINGSVALTFPGVAGAAPATDFFIIPSGLPAMLLTYGLQVGQNGNVLIDQGTSTDQYWLTQMRLFKNDFRKGDIFYSTSPWYTGAGLTPNVIGYDGQVFSYNNSPNAYGAASTVNEVTIGAQVNAFTASQSFSLRPTHPFFNILKTWPPNVPLKLVLTWSPNLFINMFNGAGAVTQPIASQVVVQIRIHSIRSEELYLEPGMRQYIMNHFDTGVGTNMNLLAQARTLQASNLYDPTFGIPNYNPGNIAAIYQFVVNRLSSHSVSGDAFQFHPVMNGSARPIQIVIAIPNPNLSYNASLTPADNCTLKTLQVLYNGQTVWDEPYTQISDVGGNMLPLFAESCRYSNTEQGLGVHRPSLNYSVWAADHAFIVINVAPSHNPAEINPNSSAPIEVRGSFTAAVPNGMAIRVGLFFDQTMLLQKNNTAVFSLPIY
jgi:hypothetical protein